MAQIFNWIPYNHRIEILLKYRQKNPRTSETGREISHVLKVQDAKKR